ncbi:hypothetical protein EV182_001899, partial [Spiromyces aspiralis]
MALQFTVLTARPTKDTLEFEFRVHHLISSPPPSAPAALTRAAQSKTLSDVLLPRRTRLAYDDHCRPRTSFSRRRTSGPIVRSYYQCRWLALQLELAFRHQVMPVFPRPPDPKLDRNPAHLDKMRAQIERWLNRLGSRSDVVANSSFEYFLSTSMTYRDAAFPEQASLSRFLNSMMSNSSDNGFHIYTPTFEIDEYDEDEFISQRKYLEKMESRFGELIEDMDTIRKLDQCFCRAYQAFVSSLSLAFGRQSLLGSLLQDSHHSTDIESAEKPLRILEHLCSNEVLEADELGRWSSIHVAGVIDEYRLTVGSVKSVINYRTKMLTQYDEAIKLYRRQEKYTNDLRAKYPSDAIIVRQANEVEVQSEKALALSRQEYRDAGYLLQMQLLLFEQEKARDIKRAFQDLAVRQLESARDQLRHLRAGLDHLRHGAPLSPSPHVRGCQSLPSTSSSLRSPPSVVPSSSAMRPVGSDSDDTDSPTENPRELLEDIVRRGLISSSSLSPFALIWRHDAPPHQRDPLAVGASGLSTLPGAQRANHGSRLASRQGHAVRRRHLKQQQDLTTINSPSKPSRKGKELDTSGISSRSQKRPSLDEGGPVERATNPSPWSSMRSSRGMASPPASPDLSSPTFTTSPTSSTTAAAATQKLPMAGAGGRDHQGGTSRDVSSDEALSADFSSALPSPPATSAGYSQEGLLPKKIDQPALYVSLNEQKIWAEEEDLGIIHHASIPNLDAYQHRR